MLISLQNSTSDRLKINKLLAFMNILACFMLSSGFTESAYAEISTIGLQKLFSTVNGVVSDSRVIFFFFLFSTPDKGQGDVHS